MKRKMLSLILSILTTAALLLSGCQAAPAQPEAAPVEASSNKAPKPTDEPASPTETLALTPEPAPTYTPIPKPVATLSSDQVTELFPHSTPGEYFPGRRNFAFVDASRDGRPVGVTVWYPAVKPEGFAGTLAQDAEADRRGAPYPLIICSTKMGNSFAGELVSHGFVVAGVDTQDSSNFWDMWLVDYPLDQLFMLEQIAAGPLENLDGMLDAENVGVMGYSFDGYDALALAGARIDPQFYKEQCASAASMNPAPAEWWIHYICDLDLKWDEFAARAGEALTTSEDGLWQPMTSPRIKAVFALAPEGAWIFGPRGLAAVDKPILIVHPTEDQYNYYDLEAIPIFEGIGTTDKALISYVGKDHMIGMDLQPKQRIEHFMAAFFGHRLAGNEEFAQYYSQEFVEQDPELAWGVYQPNP